MKHSIMLIIISAFLSLTTQYEKKGHKVTSNERIQRIENGLVQIISVKNWLNKSHTDTLNRLNLQKQMEDLKIPGLSIALIDNFEIAWTKQYGLAESGTERWVTEKTVFQSASTTKLLAGVLILDLAEKGIFELDEDVNNYLKSWKMPEHSSGRKVTLRMLLSHTSGINRPGDGTWFEGKIFPTLIQYLNGEYPVTSEGVKFEHEPGTVHQYSNHGYLILQQILEDYYNTSYPEIVTKQIFKPMGLKSSCIEYPLPKKLEKEFIKGHGSDGTVSVDDGLDPNALAQAGWMTTPTDMAEFGIELMKAWHGRSNKIISKASMQKMLHTEIIDENFEGGIRQQGLGCFLLGEGENKYFFHHGNNSPPGANAILICHPKTGKGAAIMTNGMQGLYLVMQIIPAIAKEYGWESVKN